MHIRTAFGPVDLNIVIEYSAVDSFAESGYHENEERSLTDAELDYINEHFAAEIQNYSYQNGSHNHN